MNNVVRVDWRPTSHDSLYFTFKDWYSDQRGSEITAGPNKWGFFNTHYLNTDRGFSAQLHEDLAVEPWCCDTDFGIRQQTEQFYPLTEADWDRINRDTSASRVGQFHPELNPRNVIPKVHFSTVPERAELHVRQPPRRSGRGVADVDPLEPDLDPRQPLVEDGRTTSSSRATRKATAASARGPGRVSSTSAPTPATRSTPTTATPTRCSARSATTPRSTPSPRCIGKRYIAEFYVQDTWKANRRLTLDYGVRFLWYKPWSSTQPAVVFVPERYDPGQGAAALSSRRVINSANVALRPGHRPDARRTSSSAASCPAPAIATTAWSAATIRTTRRASATTRASSRSRALGMAWDVTGDGKTAMHASVGLYHNPHVNANGLDAMARNPPAQNTPQHHLRDDGHAARGRRAGRLLEPAEQRVRDRARCADAEELQLLGRHPARDRLGHGARRDLRRAARCATARCRPTSTRSRTRRVSSTSTRRTRTRSNPTTAKPNEFLRPYLGYQDITIRSHFGDVDVQLAAGAAQPPLHPRPAVRRRLHAGEDRSASGRTPIRRPTTRCGPATPGTWRRTSRPSCTTSSSTTPGTSRTAAGCGTTC